jgi:hypothetical protein
VKHKCPKCGKRLAVLKKFPYKIGCRACKIATGSLIKRRAIQNWNEQRMVLQEVEPGHWMLLENSTAEGGEKS